MFVHIDKMKNKTKQTNKKRICFSELYLFLFFIQKKKKIFLIYTPFPSSKEKQNRQINP